MAKLTRKNLPKFDQRTINIISLSTAVLALLVSLPSAINQIVTLVNSAAYHQTEIMYYSPPAIDKSKAISAENCVASATSSRWDAYRCFSTNIISDPCFMIEDYGNTDAGLFYCPKNEQPSVSDLLLSVPEKDIEHTPLQDARAIDTSKDSPWLMYIDSIPCRLSSGALSIAFGNLPILYNCGVNSDSLSVTAGGVRDGRYFFECKSANQSTYKSCFASKVIF